MHAHYCNLYVEYDEELAQGIEFMDGELVDRTQEEVQALAASLPDEQLAYGNDRVFPTAYSAVSVSEYFADMVSFTFEVRGLILPNDADYGSPLQQKQQLVVERLEKLFPGVADFLEQHTNVLRMDPSLEIYQDAQEVQISQAEINTALDQLGPDESLVLDGFLLDHWTTEGGGDVTPFPVIKRDSFDDISLYSSLTKSGSLSYPLSLDADSIRSGENSLSVVLYTKNPEAVLTSQSKTEAFAWPEIVNDSVWAGDSAMQPLLTDIEAGILKPVRVSLETTLK